MMMSSTDVNNHGLGQGWADKELGSTGRLVYSGKADLHWGASLSFQTTRQVKKAGYQVAHSSFPSTYDSPALLMLAGVSVSHTAQPEELPIMMSV